MGVGPVGKGLGPSELGIGLIAGPHDPYEHLGLPDFTGWFVHDWHGLAAVVNEELLSGTMLLAHGAIQLLSSLAIELAK